MFCPSFAQSRRNSAARAAAAMPTNYIVKAFLSELNHACTAAPSGIVVWDVGARHGQEGGSDEGQGTRRALIQLRHALGCAGGLKPA